MTFNKGSLCSRSCAECFSHTITVNPTISTKKVLCHPHFTDNKAQAQGGETTSPQMNGSG